MVRGLRIAFLGLLTCGCAFRSHEVELTYPPLEPARTAVRETSFGPISIALAAFEDYRREPDLIGEERNDWHMHTGVVRATAPVADWMRGAVALELERAGFEVVDDPTLTGSPPLVLHGEVQRVGSSRQVRTDAAVTLDLRLKRGFKVVWWRRCNGVVSLAPDELQELERRGADPWGEALARALTFALTPLSTELRAALGREPEPSDE